VSLRFFIDENLSTGLRLPLAHTFSQHRFETAERLQLRAVDDEDLVADVAARGYDAVITGDLHQMERPSERDALRESGMQWIGVPVPPGDGASVIAEQLAMVVRGVTVVLASWPPAPTAFWLALPGSTLDQKPTPI